MFLLTFQGAGLLHSVSVGVREDPALTLTSNAVRFHVNSELGVDFVTWSRGSALKKEGQKFSHLGDLILYDPASWFSVLYASSRAGLPFHTNGFRRGDSRGSGKIFKSNWAGLLFAKFMLVLSVLFYRDLRARTSWF